MQFTLLTAWKSSLSSNKYIPIGTDMERCVMLFFEANFERSWIGGKFQHTQNFKVKWMDKINFEVFLTANIFSALFLKRLLKHSLCFYWCVADVVAALWKIHTDLVFGRKKILVANHIKKANVHSYLVPLIAFTLWLLVASPILKKKYWFFCLRLSCICIAST